MKGTKIRKKRTGDEVKREAIGLNEMKLREGKGEVL